LKYNVIYNSAFTSLAVQGAVIVAPPVEGGLPQIVLQVPRNVGACSDVPVDASQSTGGTSRPLVFAWKVQAAPGSKPISLELGAYVLAQSGAEFTIPNTLLPIDSGIMIFLTAMNMFERSANANVTVIVSALPLPTVVIDGPSMISVAPREMVQINARANSTCSGSLPVKFSWSVVKQSLQGALPSLTSNMRSVQFVPSLQGLMIGVSYTLEVKATISYGDANMSTATVAVVRVQPSNLVIKANVGNRIISSSQNIVLDVSQSFDPDLPLGSASGIAFGWSCNPIVADPRAASGFAPANRPCFDGQIAILGVTTDKLAVFGADSPLVSSSSASLAPGKYQFSVSGTKTGLSASQPRVATAIIVIEVEKQNVQLGPPLDVSIAMVPAVLPSTAPLTFRYNGPTITGRHLSKWEFKGLGSEIDLESANFTESAPGTLFLVIKRSVLSPGQTFTLRLSLIVPGRLTGWSEVTFTTSSPPSGGTCNISPRSGFAFNTTFTLSCKQWSTDPTLSPLRYQWLYYDETVSTSGGFALVSVVALTPKSTNMVQLPVSSRIHAAGLRIMARIFDKSGSMTDVVFPYRVPVQALPISLTSSSAFLSSSVLSISNMAASGDANQVFGALSALLSMDTPGKPSLFDMKWNSVSPLIGSFADSLNVWKNLEQKGTRSTPAVPSASAATQKSLTNIVLAIANSNVPAADIAINLASTVTQLVNFNPAIDDDAVIAQLYGILKQSKSMADATQSISEGYIATLARATSFFKVSLKPVVSESGSLTDRAVAGTTVLLDESIKSLIASKVPGQTPLTINTAGFNAFATRLSPSDINLKNVALVFADVFLPSDMLNSTGQSSSESLQLFINEYSQDTTPFRLISVSSLVRLTSPTLNIQILDDAGGAISPQTQQPINFVIKRSRSLIEAVPNDAKVEECRFWNVSKQIWSKQGCIVSSPPGTAELRCTCYHLTEFSGVNAKNPSTWISTPADLQGAFRFDINMDITLIPTTTIILLVVLYILSALWGHLLDVNEANKYRQDPKNFLKMDRLKFGLIDGTTLSYWKVAKIELLRKHDLLTLRYLRPYDRSSRPRVLAGFFIMMAAGAAASAVAQAFVVSNYVVLGELGVMTVTRIVIPGLVGSGVGYFVLLITKFLFSFVRRFTATAPSLNPSGEARKPVDQGPIRRQTADPLPPLSSAPIMRPVVSSSVPQLNLGGARALPVRPRPAAENRESRRQQYYNALRTMFSANGGAAMDSPPGGPSVAAVMSSRGGLRSTLSSIEEAPEPQTGGPRPRASHVSPPSSEVPGPRRVRVAGASPPGTSRSSSKVKQEELARNIDALLPAQVAYIIYTMLFIFAALCVYITMAYSFRMDSATAYIWLLSLAVIVLMHSFVWEPVRVMGIIASKFAVLHASRMAQAKALETQRQQRAEGTVSSELVG